jgi:choline-sulfatase
VIFVHRMLLALAGSSFAAFLVAVVEACQTARPGGRGPGVLALTFADLGAIGPIAWAVGLAAGGASLFLSPARPVGPSERLAALRAAPMLARARTVAAALLGGCAAAAWLVATATSARGLVGGGSPAAVGGAMAVTSAAWLVACGATGLALWPTLRRSLATAAARWPIAVDPALAGGAGIGLAALVVGVGVGWGDTGGQGPGPLAIFGVLKRPELDLRPVFYVGAMGAGAWAMPLAVLRRFPWWWTSAGALLGVGASLGVTVFEAGALDRFPATAHALEQYASLGKIGLGIVRRATDRDGDGASPYVGGGDCDHCSGADLPIPQAAMPAAPAPESMIVDQGDNLILITIDTLRAAEVGFLGYDKPTTPNLDALAATGVVFERAYSMASYTGKALAPMLIGKYPSETLRDGGHFNKYAPANTFVAERLHGAGMFTMGAASHWYFRPSWGVTQGFDVFDLSAVPDQGQGAATDSTTTSAALTDAALRMLAGHSGSGRFFLWVHYFDPHAQYVPHPGAPDFGDPARPPGWRTRAAYDGEVWFTDKHIGRLLDYARSQAWFPHTVVAVTSDHGEALNEHGIAYQHGLELWEPLVRVPLVIAAPGVAPHRIPVKRSVIDLVPTLLDLMGVPAPPPGELSGQSLVPDLVAQPGGELAERDVYLDMPDGPFTHMRRGIIHGPTPGMKLIHTGGRQYQLYDLAADPNEEEDLSSDPAKLEPMIRVLQAKRASLREVYVKADTLPLP